MGRGGGRGGAKHSKNNCAGSVFTSHERNLDKGSEGYGTVNQRLGADSIKDYDVCSLGLQPCRDPVVTPQGILYEKETILSYILKEKQRIAEETAKYHSAKSNEVLSAQKRKAMDTEEAVRKFEETECGILPMKKSKLDGKTEVKDIHTFDTMHAKDVKKGVFKASGSALGHRSVLEGADLNRTAKDSCFWIPDLTPEAKKELPSEAPLDKVLCPISGKPLRLKDLTAVKFTPINKNATNTVGMASKERYMCPVSKKNLSNSVPTAVLRTSGHVIAADMVEIIKRDMLHPITGEKLKEKDIIMMQRGGTGFAGSGVELNAKKYNPAMRAF